MKNTRTIREYDYNIWSNGQRLFLTAYELMEDITGQADYLIMNSSAYTTIGWEIDSDVNAKVITFLVQDKDWDRFNFEDYDDWVTLSQLDNEDTPKEIKRWLDALPEYELRYA